MEKYHGIVIEESMREPEVLESFEILGKKKGKNWTLVKIAIEPQDIRSGVRRLQSSLKSNFYFHAYKDDKLVVVFRDRQFWIETDRSTWDKARSYGVSVGIPESMLDFKPTSQEEEDF
jgi:hypothetical protein